MIYKAKIIEGFASQLPVLRDKTFNFTDGLNVLFGSNGCGKSTLLKCLKSYCAIEHSGWSKIGNFLSLGASSVTQFPFVYRAYTPSKECDTLIHWDGSPTLYYEREISNDDITWFYNNDVLSREGLTTEAEQLDRMAKKPSSGQTSTGIINKIFDIAQNPPDFASTTPNKNNRYELMEVEYIKSLPKNGKTTIILDEPEKSLSIPKQLELFDLFKRFQSKYQIIVATHSPFILFQDNINIIDLEDGYVDLCVDIVRKCNSIVQ
jgi:energy-coupling factor transporter ATP-binding protein EcfA2